MAARAALDDILHPPSLKNFAGLRMLLKIKILSISAPFYLKQSSTQNRAVVLIGSNQDNLPVLIGYSKSQDFGFERTYLPGRKVNDSKNIFIQQVLFGIQIHNLN